MPRTLLNSISSRRLFPRFSVFSVPFGRIKKGYHLEHVRSNESHPEVPGVAQVSPDGKRYHESETRKTVPIDDPRRRINFETLSIAGYLAPVVIERDKHRTVVYDIATEAR